MRIHLGSVESRLNVEDDTILSKQREIDDDCGLWREASDARSKMQDRTIDRFQPPPTGPRTISSS